METVENKCVYIVDDDILIRQAIHAWVAAKGYDPRSFATPLNFLDELDILKPGCALLDVRMPIIDGIQILEQHGSRLQQMKIIMMTGHADVCMAVAAMKLGANDFIEKPFGRSTVIQAIDTAFQSLTVQTDKALRTNLAKSLIGSLTQRESEVLGKLSSGTPNKLIAYELNISVRTAEMHRANIMKKLGVRSQAQLVKLAIEAGAGN